MAQQMYQWYCDRCGHKTLWTHGRHHSGERGFVCMNNCDNFKMHTARQKQPVQGSLFTRAKSNPSQVAQMKMRLSRRQQGRHPLYGKALNRRIADIERAQRLFKDFTGHDSHTVKRVMLKPLPKAGLVFGQLIEVGYRSARDGALYKHTFRSNRSRPLLIASSDGKQVLIVGGRFAFTDRGIVDK